MFSSIGPCPVLEYSTAKDNFNRHNLQQRHLITTQCQETVTAKLCLFKVHMTRKVSHLKNILI